MNGHGRRHGAAVGGPRVFDTGIHLPAGDGKVAYTLRSEMGEALDNAMLDHKGGDHTYVIAAPQAYSFRDVAAALSDISGRTITCTQIIDQNYTARAMQDGLPENTANRILGFYVDIRDNQLDETSSDLEQLLGRKPTTLTEGLPELFNPPNSGSL